ncbi:MAG: tRNA adenosine(34) deaminase TadA [Deltaproteobacteria bacterium]|nr:tRNA adenosine(34) deaminase TadA [Deltaproteobacteria bacterium]
MTTGSFSNGLDPHETYMREALAEAEEGARQGEVPVGALLVTPDGDIIARAHNQPISLNDPTAHAEILVLRQAAKQVVNYRLPGYVLYVTLEPCVMCVGAMVQARLAMVVYGVTDPKGGGIESVYQIGMNGKLNHRLQAQGGILAEESRALLQSFFSLKR